MKLDEIGREVIIYFELLVEVGGLAVLKLSDDLSFEIECQGFTAFLASGLSTRKPRAEEVLQFVNRESV